MNEPCEQVHLTPWDLQPCVKNKKARSQRLHDICKLEDYCNVGGVYVLYVDCVQNIDRRQLMFPMFPMLASEAASVACKVVVIFPVKLFGLLDRY